MLTQNLSHVLKSINSLYQYINTIRGGSSIICKTYGEAFNKFLKLPDMNNPASYIILRW